jgi:uncharacterized protein YecE (DUF72 family)
VVEVFKKYGGYIKDTAVIRLMGPDRKGIEKKSGKRWDTLLDPRDGEMSGIVTMVKELQSRDVRTYLNVNNHYEGSAPLTIRKIRQALVS